MMGPAAYAGVSRAPRWLGLALVVALHGAVLAGLLTYQPVREALGMKPLMVEFITLPAPPAPAPAQPAPKPREVKVVPKVIEPPRPPTIVSAVTPAPAPAVVAPPEPAKSLPPVEAAPAPVVAAAPAPPAAPIAVSGIEYVRAPEPVYPPMSRRLGEEGRVHLRVVVGTSGRAEQVEVQKSSGSARLDEAARAAVLRALFKPYLVNGQPVPASAPLAINFSLGN